MSASLKSSSAFFEAKYRSAGDPWNFERSAYELSRYQSILQALKGKRYRSALEPGCSVGVLTDGLATLCDHLLAIDFSATAVSTAAERCRPFAHVEVRCLELEEIESFADFDLIVLSEIGYYFTERRWTELTTRIAAEMPLQSTLLAAHWTGCSEDHEISGDRVHEILMNHPVFTMKHNERHSGFRLERLELS